jgi:NAD(P)-dependent dehydrogenase (short-subunit alcohol dehydrogenase family)
VLAARNEERLEVVANELDATASVLDATDIDAVEEWVGKAVKEHGGVSGIANCVGSLLLKPAHLTSDEEWRKTLDANLTSAFAVVRAAGRHMTKDGGSVVLVSSAAARTGFSNHEAIAAAKAGIIGLTLSAAATYASHGLRFNAVAPGLVETGLTAQLLASEASRKASLSMHALRRLGKPQDIASAIAWLLQPDQSWVTGQVLGVDGGLATVRPRPRA